MKNYILAGLAGFAFCSIAFAAGPCTPTDPKPIVWATCQDLGGNNILRSCAGDCVDGKWVNPTKDQICSNYCAAVNTTQEALDAAKKSGALVMRAKMGAK